MARTRAFPLALALGAALAAPASAQAKGGGAAPEAAPSETAAHASQGGGAAPGAVPRRRVARRAAKRIAPEPVEPVPAVATVDGVFPVQGTYTFGGDGSRFGSGRPGHIHQGQDVSAANGTPLVAPVAGTVTWKANQPGGAGIYLVVRGSADGRDYVFMHLKRGSVLVSAGSAVTAGQQLAQVGATGIASGPHLHFEIWIGGWQVRGGAPVDPLPQLQRWASAQASA
ncbi:M23 family metallopeptidase [Conexibacter stalactiti]|uniref:M23 family metallopeptidase n=1 Tax=Conexibacter stalactiti TaxID=1940611 RepID=A0ABU4HKF5_9ACTN|nr:M23 family metallopeptidase [Conexibacter stalactiti]MDW5593808.1 M23 family metallopeptidase [Conexibacter stalactiti]MEC5034450.1 M23 family metallopeptidase [Conexibacter stalactiti]